MPEGKKMEREQLWVAVGKKKTITLEQAHLWKVMAYLSWRTFEEGGWMCCGRWWWGGLLWCQSPYG